MTGTDAPNNGRVTNAILATKIDALSLTLADFIGEQRKVNKSHEDTQTSCEHRHNTDLDMLRVEQAKLSERVGLFAGGQLIISGIFAAIAGLVSASQK